MSLPMQINPKEMRVVAQAIHYLGDEARSIQNRLHAQWRRLDAGWESYAREDVNGRFHYTMREMIVMAEALFQIGVALKQTADALETADKRASILFAEIIAKIAVAGGSGSMSTPIPLPQPVPTPVPPLSGGDSGRSSRDDRREDRRIDRRIKSDERWNRNVESSDNGHFSNDWAGRSILERYLVGGGDWIIENDPRWTEYMQENPTMTEDLKDRALTTAETLFQSGQNYTNIDETFPMEIENGEGIVGYQYLHGTNANAGGFERGGKATMTPNESGGYTVQMEMTYTWNDVIDPNPKYLTDSWKSAIAEGITLGQADAYEMHITWSETTVVELDAKGNPISIYNT